MNQEKIRDSIYNHRRGLIVSVCILVGVIIICAVVTLCMRIGKTKLTIKYAPFDAEVILGAEKMKNNGTNYIEPGTYTLTVKREHFENIDTEVTIKEGEDYLYGEMSPVDEIGKQILEERLDDCLAVEALAAELEEKESEEKIKEHPILSYLPYNEFAYSISYFYDDKKGFTVEFVIDDYSLMPDAMADLYSLGDDINPADYRIVVRDFQDPFGEFKENDASNITDYLRIGFEGRFDNFVVVPEREVNEDGYRGLLVVPSDANLANEFASYPIYRMILREKNGGWEMVSKPYLVVSQYNAADVPKDFLNKLNKMLIEGEV